MNDTLSAADVFGNFDGPDVYDADDHHSGIPSPTAAAIDAIAIHRLKPQPGEPNHREFPEADDVATCVGQAMEDFAFIFDGTRLEDDLQELLWGVANLFHRRLVFIDKCLAENEDAQRVMVAEQDGSEVKSVELERKLDEGHALMERREAFEFMRDQAAERFGQLTGTPWLPRTGSRTSHAALTSAVIDSRAFQAAKRRKEIEVHCPEGTRIAFAGGMDCHDHTAIFAALDKTRAKYPDMVLLHGGGTKGAELIAAKWAEARSVAQVVFKPDWTRHAKAAPFKRNDTLLKEMPIGLIAFPGSGITENLVDKARALGIRVMRPACH